MSLKALHSEASSDEASQSATLHALCEHDLNAVETLLTQGVRSTGALPRELSERLVLAGGKRIRPYFLCLTYHGFRTQNGGAPRATSEDLHTLAAVAEWVHTATLFHDDVLDASPTRRGFPAAHVAHGNKIAILVGDFVYAEAFALLMDRGLLAPSQSLAATIKTVVEGELIQHQVATERSVAFDEYMAIARAKTGALFGWCTGTGCWAAGTNLWEPARDFGTLLGQAFQLADDLFDAYSLDPHSVDESLITEWVESSPPLPIVIAAARDTSVGTLWKSLGVLESSLERRAAIGRVLEACRLPITVKESTGLIQGLLAQAESLRREMGDNRILRRALELIEARANDGVEFAQRSAAKPTAEARPS